LKKIELYQVGTTQLFEDYTPYSTGVYFKDISVSDADRLTSPITTIFSATWEPGLSSEQIDVSGVAFDNISLSEVSTIADLYLQEGSFYFDFSAQRLYIALFDYMNFIINDNTKVGAKIGFINQAQLVDINGVNYPLNTFLGSVFYEPRLEDVSVDDTINDQKNGLFVFGNLEATIKNNDGAYDTIRKSLLGNKASLLIANISDSPEEEIETGFPYKLSADFTDFEVVRSGIVQNVDYSNPDAPTIIAIDDRANWTQKIGVNKLTVAEFPDLPDKYINDRKTLCIGAVNGVKCVPLRDDSTAASFDYFVSDTSIGAIQSVSAVYFKGELSSGKEDRYLTITSEYTIDLSTGIITILNCVKGDVYVYGVFTTMSETVEIILYLLNEYDNTAYIDSNFNKDEIEQIRNLGYETHVYIDGKGEELSKVIEKLCSDIKVDMFQQGDVLTMRQSNVLGLSFEDVPVYQIIDNPPSWNTSRTDTIKTITVNYNQDYREKLFQTYFNDENEQTATDNNLATVDESFDVNLTDILDVTDIYDTYYNRFIEIPRVVTLNRMYPYMSGLADFITFKVERNGNKIFANGIYKIISLNRVDDTVECVFFANADANIGARTLSYDALSYMYLSGRG